jgi:DNA mismatch endonuclease (patch repair protein)
MVKKASDKSEKAAPGKARTPKAKAPKTKTKEEQRSYTMSRIKSKNTSIEVVLRKALWHEGIRYRKHYKKLPGAPDIALTKHRVAVFCDGEFWHGKDWETLKPKLKGNREYWIAKIERNMKRDRETDEALGALGWRALHFWGNDIEKNLTSCVEAVKAAIGGAGARPAEVVAFGDVNGGGSKGDGALPMVAEEPANDYGAD